MKKELKKVKIEINDEGFDKVPEFYRQAVNSPMRGRFNNKAEYRSNLPRIIEIKKGSLRFGNPITLDIKFSNRYSVPPLVTGVIEGINGGIIKLPKVSNSDVNSIYDYSIQIETITTQYLRLTMEASVTSDISEQQINKTLRYKFKIYNIDLIE